MSVTHYGRCALCPNVHTCLPPDGPDNATILLVGEAPGKNEERRRKIFVGGVGQELDDHYLPLAGLRRDRVRIINAISCLPDTANGRIDISRPKDLALLESCTQCHVYPEIEGGTYQLIVPLGAFACRAVFGEPFDLELRHGIPATTPFGIPAFPMFHPAAGLHEPKKVLQIRTDWHRLRRYLRGTLIIPTDTYSNPDYQEVNSDSALTYDPTLPIAIDTESDKTGRPWCITYTQREGEGRLIRASNPHLLKIFHAKLRYAEAPIVLHYNLHDWSVLGEMDIFLPYGKVEDTASLAFHIGNVPQGLKALAFRELGMDMQDFDDLVTPYSTQEVLTYYQKASCIEWQRPPEELIIDSKTRQWKVYRPQSLSTKFKRFFTDLSKNPEKDVFDMWTKNWEQHQTEVERAVGPWPGKCITHVPFDQALYYACRDADATLRVWRVLRRMRKFVRRYPQERWGEMTSVNP